MQVKLITDGSLLDKRIAGIKASGAKLDKEIHVVAVSAISRVADHGDVGYVNRLYLALPKGARKAAMTSWVLTYAGVVANDDKATKADKPFAFSKEKATDVPGSIADPWYDHKPDADPDQVYDLQKAIDAIVKKAKKPGRQLVNAELLVKLVELSTEGAAVPADEVEEVLE